MKRSHAIFVGATGLIFAGAYIGQVGKTRIEEAPAAEAPAEARLYASLEECMKAHQGWGSILPGSAGQPAPLSPGQAQCQRDFADASATHVQAAPKFPSQTDCEAQYGSQQCRPATFNGSSVFVPAMLGFMVANALNGQRNSQALLPPMRTGTACPPGQTPETMPGCTAPPRSGSSTSGSGSGWRSYSTSSGHTVSRDTSKAASSAVSVPGSATGAPVARTSIGAIAARPSSYSRASTSSSTVSRSGFGSTGRSISSSSS
ncbi:MAG: DUF1190 domain-containing protein [Rhabdaerophilum sp.]